MELYSIEYRKVLWNDPSDGLCLAWAMSGNSHNAPCSRQVICSLQEFAFDNAVRTLELKDCSLLHAVWSPLFDPNFNPGWVWLGWNDEMQGLKRFSVSLEFFCWSMLVRFSAIPPIQSCPKILCFRIFLPFSTSSTCFYEAHSLAFASRVRAVDFGAERLRQVRHSKGVSQRGCRLLLPFPPGARRSSTCSAAANPTGGTCIAKKRRWNRK